MSRMPFVLLFSLVIFMGGPVVAQTTKSSSRASEAVDLDLIELRDRLAAAFANRDVDTIAGLMGPEVVMTWQNGSRNVGIKEFREFFRQMIGDDQASISKLTTTRLLDNEPVIYGDTAIAWGKSKDDFQLRDGDEFSLESVWTAILLKKEDGWQVVGYHVSTDAFNNPMLTVAKQYLITFATVGAVLGFLLGAVLTWFVMSSTRRLVGEL